MKGSVFPSLCLWVSSVIYVDWHLIDDGRLRLASIALVAVLSLLPLLLVIRHGFQGRRYARRLLAYSAMLCGLLAGAWPIAPALAHPADLARGIFTFSNLWPNLCVLFFASRLLIVLAEESTFFMWDPKAGPQADGQADPVSVGGGLFAGFALTIAFYVVIQSAAIIWPSEITDWTAKTFFGSSVLYYPPVLIFWWAMALQFGQLFAYGAERRDLSFLKSMVTRIEARGSMRDDYRELGDTIRQHAAGRLHRRTIRIVLDALRRGSRSGQMGMDAELETGLALQGYLDQSNRGFVQALITLLPLLGFLGTVVGISQSISQFSQALGGKDAMKQASAEALKASLGGLGLAFETTLIGLVLTIIAHLFSSYLAKREESLLAEVEVFCRNHVMGRLYHEKN